MRNTIIIALLLAGCKQVSAPVVNISGSLHSIMMKNETQATFDLRDLDGQPNVYALGAVEGLKGEILVMDSQPFVTSVDEDTFSLTNSFDAKATLLVSTTVKEWHSYTLAESMGSKELASFAKKMAEENQVEEPFPFLVKGKAQQVKWHIVNGGSGRSNASHSDHAAAGFSSELTDSEVEVLGFYSTAHQGVFTHRGQNSHMHFKGGSSMGHVDDLIIDKGSLLFIPKSY